MPFGVIIIPMKRILFMILVVAFALSSVSAVTLEEFYEQVLETSPAVKEMQISKRNDFVESVMSSLKGPTWSINLQSLKISAQKNFAYPASISLPGLDISYTSPEREDRLSFDSRLSIGEMRYSWETSDSNKNYAYKMGGTDFSWRFGLSKNYEFKSWDNTDWTKGLSDLQRRNGYETSLLEFENNFLEDVVRILEWEKETSKKFAEYQVIRQKYDADMASGKLKADTPDETKRKAEVDVADKEYEQQAESIKETAADFKTRYGLEYQFIDSAKSYELEFTPDPAGNLDVYIKYADYMTAVQKVEEKTGKQSTLSLSANVEPRIGFKDNFEYEKTSLSTSVTASYNTGKLSVDGSFSTEYGIDSLRKGGFDDGSPSFSVGVSWSNTPSSLTTRDLEFLRRQYTTYDSKSNTYVFDDESYERTLNEAKNATLKREVLELEQTERSMLSAKREYERALQDYNRSANELVREIKDYKNRVDVQKIKSESNKKVFKQYEELFAAGKATTEELSKAIFDVEADRVEELILNIRSRILYNKIQIIQM